MRRLAETGINPNSYDPGQVVAFFARFPPRTATGNARHALALMQQGRMGEARIAARTAWIGGTLSPDEEARLLSLFGSCWTSAEPALPTAPMPGQGHLCRAQRMVDTVLPPPRPVHEPRLPFPPHTAPAP